MLNLDTGLIIFMIAAPILVVVVLAILFILNVNSGAIEAMKPKDYTGTEESDSKAGTLGHIMAAYGYHVLSIILANVISHANDDDKILPYVIFDLLYIAYWIIVPKFFQRKTYMPWIVLVNFLIGMAVNFIFMFIVADSLDIVPHLIFVGPMPLVLALVNLIMQDRYKV